MTFQNLYIKLGKTKIYQIHLLKGLEDKDIILGSMEYDTSYKHSIANTINISKPKAPFWIYAVSEIRQRINIGIPEYDTGLKLSHHCITTYKKKHEIAIIKFEMLYGINWATKEGQDMRRRIFKEKNVKR